MTQQAEQVGTLQNQVQRLEESVQNLKPQIERSEVLAADLKQTVGAVRSVGRGFKAAVRTGAELVRARSGIGSAIRAGAEAVGRAGRDFDRKYGAIRQTRDSLDQRLRGAPEECERNDRRIQHCCEGYGRALSVIHPEAEQKRNAGDRWDRVAGRIESLIQQARTRSPRLGLRTVVLWGLSKKTGATS